MKLVGCTKPLSKSYYRISLTVRGSNSPFEFLDAPHISYSLTHRIKCELRAEWFRQHYDIISVVTGDVPDLTVSITKLHSCEYRPD